MRHDFKCEKAKTTRIYDKFLFSVLPSIYDFKFSLAVSINLVH